MLPLGIDIGAARLRVAVLTANGDEPHVRNVVVRELPPGAASSGLVAEPDIVAGLLRDAVAEAGVRERRCVTAICEPAATVKRVTLPRMPALEQSRAAKFEARRFTQDPISEYTVRFVPSGDPGEFVLGLARTAVLESRTKALRGAGLRPLAVDHEAFAWRRALPDVDCLVDVGLARTTVVAFADSLPLVRTIEGGGDAITTAIARALGIDAASAEHRKRTIGEGGAAGDVIARLVAAIADVIVDARSAGQSVRRIALAGNGARVAGLAQAVERATGIATLMAAFPGALSSEYPKDVMRAAAADWLFAYGLALWSLA